MATRLTTNHIATSDFEEVVCLFEDCADESRSFCDCDSCLAKRECVSFWDTYVVSKPGEKDYKKIVLQKFEELKGEKHRGTENSSR